MIVEHDLAPVMHTVLVAGTESRCDVQTSHESELPFVVQGPQLVVVELVDGFAGSHMFHVAPASPKPCVALVVDVVKVPC